MAASILLNAVTSCLRIAVLLTIELATHAVD